MSVCKIHVGDQITINHPGEQRCVEAADGDQAVEDVVGSSNDLFAGADFLFRCRLGDGGLEMLEGVNLGCLAGVTLPGYTAIHHNKERSH